MTNYNNLKLIENKKPFELVQEIENYQIKKSPLSPAARDKVISKSGSDYLSKNKEGYGPCEYWDCPYSSRFYLKIGFGGRNINIWERYETGYLNNKDIYWITMENVQQARSVLRKFEKGNANASGECYWVCECISVFSSYDWSENTRNAREKQAEIIRKLKYYIDSHERGNEVYEPYVDLNRNNGDCSVIM